MLERPIDVPADRLYRELQQSTAVCSNCLLILDVSIDAIHPYSPRDSINQLLRRVFVDERDARRHDGRPRYRNHAPDCPHCGVHSIHEQHRPLSKTEVKLVAANLSVTLDILEVRHDWFRLISTALELKTEPETASRDDDNLANALETAVEDDIERDVAAATVREGPA